MAEKEYIEREATIKRFTFATLDCLGMEPQIRASDVVKAIDAIPAADVVEVRHGKWVATDKYMVDKCSNCQFEMDWDDVPLWLVDMPHFKDSCPNCGAKMDGGVNDGKID